MPVSGQKMADDRERLWEEIKTLTTKAARIKAKRDTDWYLRALGFMLKTMGELLAGLAEAITAWRIANGLDESGESGEG